MFRKIIAIPDKNPKSITSIGFNINQIKSELLELQNQFIDINHKIQCQRDYLSDEIIENLLDAYGYINRVLKNNPENQMVEGNTMLELNYIVNLGINYYKKQEYKGFLKDTDRKFSKHCDSLLKWYRRHLSQHDDPYNIAAGLFVRILARPQLFIEGNHRTGTLIADYHLLLTQEKPFILTIDNAIEYFNLASNIKFRKKDIGSRFKRLTGWHDEKFLMREFLKRHSSPAALTSNQAMLE